MTDKTLLQGRRIIVTGAATGIGNAAARAFCEAGARVAGIYNTTMPEDRIDASVIWHHCDMRDQARVRKVFETVATEFGGLDVLYHAAGTWQPSSPGEITEEQVDFQIDNTLKATIWANQIAFTLMREKGGRIINTGSSEGVTGSAKAAAYGIAKAAVHAWTRSCAKAWGRYGITVNAIAPAIATRGLTRLKAHLGKDQVAAFETNLRQMIPLTGSPGDPLKDAAPLLVFLAGEGSGFITGQLLAVDGGLLMLGA
jgi:NAD(P)-dependent dehydrogenase (short-subunit alcohol dehydrogenase family)